MLPLSSWVWSSGAVGSSCLDHSVLRQFLMLDIVGLLCCGIKYGLMGSECLVPAVSHKISWFQDSKWMVSHRVTIWDRMIGLKLGTGFLPPSQWTQLMVQCYFFTTHSGTVSIITLMLHFADTYYLNDMLEMHVYKYLLCHMIDFGLHWVSWMVTLGLLI
jgi:hypothetical protein